jgi:hypothetical protein
VDALHRQAGNLAPRFADRTADAGCTNYQDLPTAGPRQLRAYALLAQAHCWNEIAGILEEARDAARQAAPAIPDNAVIEWSQPNPHFSNVAPTRRIGRVIHTSSLRGHLVVQPAEGFDANSTVHVRPEDATVIAERAEAGWASLAGPAQAQDDSDESFADPDCTCPGDDIDTFCPLHGHLSRIADLRAGAIAAVQALNAHKVRAPQMQYQVRRAENSVLSRKAQVALEALAAATDQDVVAVILDIAAEAL